MADPLSTASGVLALATFAFQSSVLLYKAVASFQSSQRIIRELKEELEALNGVLEALQETATNTDADLTLLRLPLHRCGKACEDFQALIARLSVHSNGSRTSFRDWAKLRYMGDDIVGFKNMLAGYKATIMIALGAANMRRTAITVTVLEEYKVMIANATADLEEHLQEIDTKLQVLSQQSQASPYETAAEQQQMQQERDSTEQCLHICARVAAHISELRPFVLGDDLAPSEASTRSLQRPSLARSVTADAFAACSVKLSETTIRLENHLHSIENEMPSASLPRSIEPNTSQRFVEQQTIREEFESIRQCLAICSKASAQASGARTNVFEDISMADDGHQVLVSTIGDLISAKRITAGVRSRQWLGQMSDESLQQLVQSRDGAASESWRVPHAERSEAFEGRYGAGVQLSSEGTIGKAEITGRSDGGAK